MSPEERLHYELTKKEYIKGKKSIYHSKLLGSIRPYKIIIIINYRKP